MLGGPGSVVAHSGELSGPSLCEVIRRKMPREPFTFSFKKHFLYFYSIFVAYFARSFPTVADVKGFIFTASIFFIMKTVNIIET